MYNYTPTSVLANSCHTAMAEELNAAMSDNPAARAAYQLVWGYAWEPLPTPGYAPASETSELITRAFAERAA